VRSGTAGHAVASEPTSAGRCGLKIQLTWQRVDTRYAPCLDLELVCGGTRSSGYRHIQFLEKEPSEHFYRIGGKCFFGQKHWIADWLRRYILVIG
jgi:hypothetical protein